jgi:hypothetical protein
MRGWVPGTSEIAHKTQVIYITEPKERKIDLDKYIQILF